MSAPTLTVVRGRRQRPTLAQYAAQGDIRISIHDIDERQCDYCGYEDRFTTVCVYGRPADDVDATHEVCDECAPAVVDEELSRAVSTPLTVEVAPSSASVSIPAQRSAA